MRFPDTVVLATRNLGKQAELHRILTARGIACEVLTLADFPDYTEEVVEDAADFEGNALLKARAAFVATGVAALADDSGLCVDALNGMPGVLSARWSGNRDDSANVNLVLDQLHDVPDARRTAAFVAALAFVANDTQVVTRGEMRGVIIRESRGSGGFGYDPIFIAEGLLHTNGEIAPEVKDARSHRRQAIDALLDLMKD